MRVIGALVATLRMDWFARQSIEEKRAAQVSVWIGSPSGILLPVGSAPSSALPDRASLTPLLESDDAILQKKSRGGDAYAYAATRLSDGLHLLVGYNASADVGRGRAVLVGRFVEIALLLLLGLVAVWVGVHLAVVQPLRHLTRAVGRWRGGAGWFHPGKPDRRADRGRRIVELVFAGDGSARGAGNAIAKRALPSGIADAGDPSPCEEQPTNRCKSA